MKNGFGILKASNGITYVGSFYYDRKHGPGKYLYSTGKDKTGIWDENKLIKVLTKAEIEADAIDNNKN